MCLGVPGRVLSVEGTDPLTRLGKVSFGGLIREVSLAYVPEAKPEDYVVVHAGFAISVLDAAEAAQVLDDIKKVKELEPQS